MSIPGVCVTGELKDVSLLSVGCHTMWVAAVVIAVESAAAVAGPRLWLTARRSYPGRCRRFPGLVGLVCVDAVFSFVFVCAVTGAVEAVRGG